MQWPAWVTGTALGVVLAPVSFSFKALGPAVLGDHELPAAARGVIALLAPSLLAGLVVVEPGSGGPNWTLLLGLAAVIGARWCRAPMLPAILAGVAITALARLLLT